MKTPGFFSVASIAGLVVACSSAPKPVARAPMPSLPPPPPEQAQTAPAAPSQSQVVISDEIRAACGISDQDAYFAFDSAKIRQQDHGVLAKVAECFRSGPLKGRDLRLVGHADPRGSDEYNMVLGGHRAGSVRDYLATVGLAQSRMSTTSRGEMDATGHDEPTWAKDRRVDVILAGPNERQNAKSAARQY